MDFEAIIMEGTLILKIKGELDQYNADRYRLRFDMKIVSPEVQKVVIDISELSFMDSSGVGFLVGRFKTAKAFAKELVLVCNSNYINKLLSTCGIEKLIKKYTTIEEALS
ncbi:anti-sigma-factor antagonist [Caldicellulosiruptor obsidiansis OB47]|jgi:stage II sporulation protein AA (anti-sigma F factor antagonist)|uniref:Anti-sigma factor antagonist n=1 Tax=Caldicellulosiruptor obsidiansis (strain ATCC BAA-2073 / JCM 16842 / OB47) TaxID=608506 RepID=D9TJM9_CALOO|nr:anti-sigma factor antagonist [Caldicellulosiruptor obsidiansis]ADL42211.1 anti-sigma-factor antagonist [Caldicellulosiruptor obsidiansis OB47]